MQHILIPTDFSQHAWNATSYALQFFKSVNTTFHFLHIETPNDLSKNPLHCDDLISTKIIPEKKDFKNERMDAKGVHLRYFSQS